MTVNYFQTLSVTDRLALLDLFISSHSSARLEDLDLHCTDIGVFVLWWSPRGHEDQKNPRMYEIMGNPVDEWRFVEV